MKVGGQTRRRERDAEGREGGVQGGDAPSLLGIWDRRELPQRDPGPKTGRKRIWRVLCLSGGRW